MMPILQSSLKPKKNQRKMIMSMKDDKLESYMLSYSHIFCDTYCALLMLHIA